MSEATFWRMEAERYRDRAYPVADEDVSFPEERRCDKALDTASEVCPRCKRQHTWLMET